MTEAGGSYGDDADVDAKEITERLLGRPLELRRRDVTKDMT